MVPDSRRSTLIVYLIPLIPLYRTHSSDGRAACFPNPLTRTFEPFFRCFNELSLLINPGTTQSFSVTHHHTWGLRGASRGRDKLPLVCFAAIVPANSPDSVSGFSSHRITATKQICLEFLAIGNGPYIRPKDTQVL